jgi:hypothetical protein
MNLTKFLREVLTTPYYRKRPVAVLRFAYAKWIFARYRMHDPCCCKTCGRHRRPYSLVYRM